MSFIVNSSFFVEKIYIPNLTNTADLAKLNNFIAKYEPTCLLEILGYPLFKLIGVESSQRMTDLLGGAEFTNERSELDKWKGIKHDTNQSLIADYIYFYIQEYNASHTTGTGNAVSKAEAGVIETPAHKMAQAWNRYSDEVQQMCSFLWLKKTGNDRVYPEFSYYQFCKTLEISRRIDSIFSL